MFLRQNHKIYGGKKLKSQGANSFEQKNHLFPFSDFCLCPNSLSSTQPLLSSTDPAALLPDANDDDDQYPRSPTSTAPAPSATSPPSSSSSSSPSRPLPLASSPSPAVTLPPPAPPPSSSTLPPFPASSPPPTSSPSPFPPPLPPSPSSPPPTPPPSRRMPTTTTTSTSDLVPIRPPPPPRPPRSPPLPPPLPLDHRPWLRRRRRPQPCRIPCLLLRLRRCLLFLRPPLLQPPLPLPFPLLFPLTIVSPSVPHPCPCFPATLDPEPAEEIPTSNPSTKVGGREGVRDRQRAVRIAWEKLVRWSRSWRSKAKSDVLELSAEAELSARYGEFSLDV